MACIRGCQAPMHTTSCQSVGVRGEACGVSRRNMHRGPLPSQPATAAVAPALAAAAAAETVGGGRERRRAHPLQVSGLQTMGNAAERPSGRCRRVNANAESTRPWPIDSISLSSSGRRRRRGKVELLSRLSTRASASSFPPPSDDKEKASWLQIASREGESDDQEAQEKEQAAEVAAKMAAKGGKWGEKLSADSSEESTFKSIAELLPDVDLTTARPEAIAAALEMRPKQVEILTRDGLYKPKVSTWGVFPRPLDLSKAYGGGRTIDPTKPLEAEEVRSEKDKKIKEMLERYKKDFGKDMAPEQEAKVEAKIEAGKNLMDRGKLKDAMEVFDQAFAMCAPLHQLAGEAKLQRAICLDSLGRSDEAREGYKKLMDHPDVEIRTRSKRMLFGFEAMENLKVDTNYVFDQTLYDSYLQRFISPYDMARVKDDEPVPAWISALALAVFLGPLLGVAALIYLKANS